MLGWRVAALVCALVSAFACASSTPREPATRADAPEVSVGWVEFVVRDAEIPYDARLSGIPGPPRCELNVLLDRKSVVSTTLRPTGSEPPYSLAFRFRVRAVPGGYTATFRYSGCGDDPGGKQRVVARAPLLVLADGVTQVRFDGVLVSTRPPTLLSSPASWAN